MADLSIQPHDLLARHVAGDWGYLSTEDAQANATALRQGTRLLSAYGSPTDPGDLAPGQRDERLWVITEGDRSMTTILRPDEY